MCWCMLCLCLNQLSPLKRISPNKLPTKHELVLTPQKTTPQKTTPSKQQSPAQLDTPVQKKPSPRKTPPNNVSSTVICKHLRPDKF